MVYVCCALLEPLNVLEDICFILIDNLMHSVVIRLRRPHFSNNTFYLVCLSLTDIISTLLPSMTLLISFITDWLYSPQLVKCINSIFLVDIIQSIKPLPLYSPISVPHSICRCRSSHSLLYEREVSVSVKQLNSDVNELIRCVNELATANPN